MLIDRFPVRVISLSQIQVIYKRRVDFFGYVCQRIPVCSMDKIGTYAYQSSSGGGWGLPKSSGKPQSRRVFTLPPILSRASSRTTSKESAWGLCKIVRAACKPDTPAPMMAIVFFDDVVVEVAILHWSLRRWSRGGSARRRREGLGR